MNDDVALTTKGLIPEILSEDSITREDRAVLINAVYLLAGWMEPFLVDETELEPFSAPGGDRSVPTMRGSREAVYATAGGWALVCLPLGMGLQAEVLLPPEAGQHPTGSPPQRLWSCAVRQRATSWTCTCPAFDIDQRGPDSAPAKPRRPKSLRA